jgi:NIPSNAP
MAEYQLRDYTIRPGEMEEWLAEWRAHVVPLRRQHGFHVAGAWTAGEDRFVWILAFDGPNGWEEADRAYYESPERKRMNPDPARHILESKTSRMSSIET